VKARNTSEPEWPVKGADLYYTYRDRYYHVGPEHFGCSGEVFEVLSDELIDALYEAGARDMFYAGMLD